MNKSFGDEAIVCDGSQSQVLVLGSEVGRGSAHGVGRLWEDAWRDFFQTDEGFEDKDISRPMKHVWHHRVFYVPKGYQVIRREGGPFGFEIIFKDEGGNERKDLWKDFIISQSGSTKAERHFGL